MSIARNKSKIKKIFLINAEKSIQVLQKQDNISKSLRSRPYLIQRGKFRSEPIAELEGKISSFIDLDYMGSAEFEFGELPLSLERIKKGVVKNEYDFFEVNGLKVFGEIVKSDAIKEGIVQLSKGSIKTKHFSGMTDISSEIKESFHTIVNFWWDIENDYFVFKPSEFVEENIIRVSGFKK